MIVKPPLGVVPRYLWAEDHPDPTVAELAGRYADVLAAVVRYRKAGAEVPRRWLAELGVFDED